ncbi:MAG: glycosyltransferase family 2 protein [Cyanobacteria bacterium P01_F01_bin.53]
MLDRKDAIVLCVVKDGESLVQAFIEHYLSLGFKHIVFLDNGSTDKTIEIIKSYKQTTLLASSKPFGTYYVIFKNFLLQTFGRDRWCVVADVDEFLHFPLERSLNDVLTYLNQNSYDTVCIQMLDMFSKAGVPLPTNQSIDQFNDQFNDGAADQSASPKQWDLTALTSVFDAYDLSNITRRPYVRKWQPKIHSGIRFLYGGIRKTVFQGNCFLTKEAMMFVHRGTRLQTSHLQSPHLLKRSKVADFSAVFLHYKFTEDFYDTTLKAIETENHWRQSKEYKAYFSVLKKQIETQQQAFSLWQSSSLVLKHIDDLIAQDFLFVSNEFSNSGQPSPVLEA